MPVAQQDATVSSRSRARRTPGQRQRPSSNLPRLPLPPSVAAASSSPPLRRSARISNRATTAALPVVGSVVTPSIATTIRAHTSREPNSRAAEAESVRTIRRQVQRRQRGIEQLAPSTSPPRPTPSSPPPSLRRVRSSETEAPSDNNSKPPEPPPDDDDKDSLNTKHPDVAPTLNATPSHHNLQVVVQPAGEVRPQRGFPIAVYLRAGDDPSLFAFASLINTDGTDTTTPVSASFLRDSGNIVESAHTLSHTLTAEDDEPAGT